MMFLVTVMYIPLLCPITAYELIGIRPGISMIIC